MANRSAIEAQKLTYHMEKGQLSVIGCEIILQKKEWITFWNAAS